MQSSTAIALCATCAACLLGCDTAGTSQPDAQQSVRPESGVPEEEKDTAAEADSENSALLYAHDYEPRATSSYGPERLEVALGPENLRFRFFLRTGIVERFEQQMAEDDLQGGAVGCVDFSAGAEQFRLWVPTGFSWGQPDSPARLVVAYELHGEKDGQLTFPEHTELLRKDYRQDPNHIWLDGRSLTILVPLDALGDPPPEKIVIKEFSPF